MTNGNLARTGMAALLLSVSMLSNTAFAQEKDTLVVGMATAITTLDPHEASSSPNNSTNRHIWDSLINRGGAAENLPQLAKDWRRIDDTHWEFTLRDDVKFHDGSVFDSEDVVASLLRVRDKPSQSYSSYTRMIKNVEATGPHTVVVETVAPDPLILNSLSRLRIISADCADASVASFETGECAIGTGPFRFVSYTPGADLKLERNEDYFDGAFAWKNLTIRFLPDDGARLAALLTHEADLIEKLPAEGTGRVEEDAELKVVRKQSTRIVYLGMDSTDDGPSPFVTAKDGSALTENPLADLRVRKALLMAMNREAIVDRVMQFNGTVAHQWVAEGYFGHSPDVVPVAYDTEGAKALLAEAGYPDGLKLTLHSPSGRYVKDSEVTQAAGQMLARIGIDTSVEVMPWSMYADRYAAGEFSVFLASWGINTGEVSNPAIAIIATKDADKGTGRANGGNVSDPEIDELLAKATSTLDEGEREELLRQVSKLTADRVWILPMHYENVVLGASAGVNYQPRGDQYTLSYYITPAQ